MTEARAGEPVDRHLPAPRPVTGPADRASFTYSIVVPVFNSEDVVGRTDRARSSEVFEGAGLSYELILVNDGSRDGSWEVIAAGAPAPPARRRAQPAANYGQHHANLAGLREATGDYVITMDDDLQNPPDQALRPHRRGDERPRRRLRPLRAQAGAPATGELGSKLISMINRRVFGAAARPRRLQLPDPAPRRRRPDLRVPHRPPLHHRAGADVLQQPRRRAGAPRAAPGRARATTAWPASCGWCSRSCSATRCSRCGRRRWPGSRGAGAASCSAPSTWSRSFFVDTPVPGWTTIAVLLSIFNGVDDRAAVDARRVRRPHPQRGQRAGDLPRHRSGCRLVTPSPAGRRRPAVRDDVPALAAGRAPRDHHGPAARGRSPRCSCAPSSSGRGLGWYRETYFAHATDERVLGEKSTSYIEDPEAAERALRRARRGHPGAGHAARPGRAGGVELAVQHRPRPGEARPGDGAAREPRGAGRLGPPPRRRSRRSPTSSAAATPTTWTPWYDAFPATTHVLFLQDLLDDDEAVGTLFRRLGVDPDVQADRRDPASTRAANRSPTCPPTSWRRCGSTSPRATWR